ncbi:MAG: hypothetical protein AAF431_04960 [Pseudomonadota bacterium]
MTDTETLESKIFKFQFNVRIANSTQNVWALMTQDVNSWWMQDFRALGTDSSMSLALEPGGSLLESNDSGGSLEWYKVQMVVPGESLYLVGYLAPDWGGPTVSMLKLSLEADGEGCVLTVADALLGNVTDARASTIEDGWKLMFGDGFKIYAESEHCQ